MNTLTFSHTSKHCMVHIAVNGVLVTTSFVHISMTRYLAGINDENTSKDLALGIVKRRLLKKYTNPARLIY